MDTRVELCISDPLAEVLNELNGVKLLVQRVRALHVNTKTVKDGIRKCVQNYFRKWQPVLATASRNAAELVALDGAMHELLRFTQRRTHVADYRAEINLAVNAINELELKLLQPRIQEVVASNSVEPQQSKIIEGLRRLSSSAANSYEQGLMDIRDGNRKSWRGTALEFREALREVLDYLAPDDAVTKVPGFRLEDGTMKPTMKQKAIFILRARRLIKSRVKTLTDGIDVVECSIGNFVRSVYTRSSVAVHNAVSQTEARRVRNYVTLVLSELLEIGE